MISRGSCGEVRQALAVYVLGAIEPADRTMVDRHLGDCAGCREELAGFAPLPALLRKVPLQEAAALVDDDARGSPPADQPSQPALGRMLVQAGRRHRRDLRTHAAAAGAVGLLAGAGLFAAWHAARQIHLGGIPPA